MVWQSSLRPLLVAALVVVTLTVASSRVATGAAPDAVNQQRLELTIRYLQEAQNLDGGFAGKPGGASSPTFSAWVAYALAAASINPQDQAKPGGRDVYSYLVSNNGPKVLRDGTDFERVLLVALAAGTDPRDFGGIDLIERVTSFQLPDGSFYQDPDDRRSAQVNTTAFAVLSLSQIDRPAIQERVARAAAWLKTTQSSDGSWGYQPRGGYSVDMTGAVLQALNAAGEHDTPEQAKALAYLRSLQNDDGGFPELRKGDQTNAMSTAWAVQGLWSAGIDPRTWKKPGGDPLDAMARFQDRQTGAVRYLSGNDMNLIWSTAQVAPAFAGQALPVPPAPRKDPNAAPPPQEELPAPSHSDGYGNGAGGFEEQKGGGVIAGGGGDAAPLFSQPKAQSQGRTRGGVRDTTKVETTAKEEPHERTAASHREPASAARKRGEQMRMRAAKSQPEKEHDLGAGTSGSKRNGSHGRDSGSIVTGRLLGKQTSNPLKLPVAPGLRGAQRGGSTGPAMLATVVAVLIAALLAGLLSELRTPNIPRITHQ